jgi:hypothetical protein
VRNAASADLRGADASQGSHKMGSASRKHSMNAVTAQSVGDLAAWLRSFQRWLRAANESRKTCATYAKAGIQL